MASDGPYLFDVGVVALAHAGTPVSDRALSYVRRAIAGEIDATVPYAALIGAHHVLSSYYGFSNDHASRLMTNLMDAKRIHWYGRTEGSTVRSGFERAGESNVDAWDGYYAEVALEEGVETVLTLDDDFESVDGIDTEILLTPEEFATLNDYMGY